FCTPGFVMSLYAMGFAPPARDRHDVTDALAGNLCRCTGYGPLIAAAQDVAAIQRPDWDVARLQVEQRLIEDMDKDMDDGDSVHALSFEDRQVFIPRSSDALAGLYARHPDAVLVAGATDAGLWVTKQHRELKKIILLGDIRELHEVRTSAGVLRIGAGATYAEAMDAVTRAFPDFGELLRRIGAQQVRAAGTIGGNIANGSPIGDTPPALIALGAVVVLRKGMDRRTLLLEDFFLAYGRQDRQPGEFVEAIEAPLLDDPQQLRCYKISKRFDQDISTLCGCFNITTVDGVVTQARIAFGGMAATPQRARRVEESLVGKEWTQGAIEAAIPAFEQDFTPLTDMRGSAAYRMRTAQNLLRKYFIERTDAQVRTRLASRALEVL
ncbi:MAG: FAD binding domain-containing protein, partial [Hyphomicrobiales bacterium]|nr:FAD binding domain-containing protein [Hyphomicrobiales bacterium]